MRKEIRDYAHKTGFYVIEQTGDTVKISVPERLYSKRVVTRKTLNILV